MATNYKVLGQSAPSATTPTTLYTVPAGAQSVVSTIVVTNRGGEAGRFRLSVRPDGAAQADQHYVAYDTAVSGNSFVTLTLGLTVDATDVITVYASSANFSFQAFGSEIIA